MKVVQSMDWNSKLQVGMKKSDVNALSQIVSSDRAKYESLINYFTNAVDPTKRRKAIWVFSTASGHSIVFFEVHKKEFLQWLAIEQDYSVIRELLKIVRVLKLSDSTSGMVIDRCFQFLNDPMADTAVHYTSARVILKYISQFPELKGELSMHIQRLLPHVTKALQFQFGKMMVKLNSQKGAK